MVIEPRVVQFWSEIILVISYRTRAVRLIDFEITRMISAQIALHSVQLPLLINEQREVKLTQSRITFDIQSLFFGAKRVIKTKREDERYLVLFMGILIFEDSWISFVPSTVVIFLFIGPLLQWLCHLKSFLICTNDCSLPLSDDQGVEPGAWGLRLRPTDPRPPDLRTSPSLTKNSCFRP